VIKKAKQTRAIVLTTHAMARFAALVSLICCSTSDARPRFASAAAPAAQEEAAELCDRLGIFVDGTLRCVGAPRELTARYGDFLVLTLTALPARVPEVEAFVRQLSPGAARTHALGGTLTFDLPLREVSLAAVFAAVTARKAALGIVDWGVSSVTLEEARTRCVPVAACMRVCLDVAADACCVK
jgi:hypothetical protein